MDKWVARGAGSACRWAAGLFCVLALPGGFTPVCRAQAFGSDSMGTEITEALARARDLARLRRFAAAESIDAAVLERDPVNREAQYDLATTLAWDGRYDAAIIAFRRVLQLQPENVGLRLEIARVLAWQAGIEHRPDGLAAALVEYDSLLAAQPDHIAALVQAGGLELRLGRLKSAKAHLESACARRTGDPEAPRLLAEVLSRMHQRERAIAVLDEFLANHAGDVALYWTLAGLLVEEGRLGDAAARYRAILDQEPDHIGARVELGRLLNRQGHATAAEEQFESARAAKPANPEPVIGLAELRAADGRFHEAAALYGRALELDPGNRDARSGALAARWASGAGFTTETGMAEPSAGLNRRWVIGSLDLHPAERVSVRVGSTRWKYRDGDAPALAQLDYWLELGLPCGNKGRVDARATRADFADHPTREAGLYGGSIAITLPSPAQWRWSFGVARLPVSESYATVHDSYRSDVASVGVGWTPRRDFEASANAMMARRDGVWDVGYWNDWYGRWSTIAVHRDRSTHRAVDAQAWWTLPIPVGLALGCELRAQDATSSIVLPYWAPAVYRRQTLAARLHRSGRAWDLGLVGRCARASDDHGWGWGASGWLSHRWSSHLEVAIDATRSSSGGVTPWSGTVAHASLGWRR